MLKQLYDSVLKLASHPKAEMWLFLVAFAESSFFPVPPDVLLIPMVIVNFDKAFRYALVCTVGSVLGGIFGYAIGAMFYGTAGEAIIAFYNLGEYFTKFQGWYKAYDAVIIGIAGFSPIPYKIFTIASGMMDVNLFNFIVASALSRGARFFIIAWLLWRGGVKFKSWIEDNFYPLTMAAAVILVLLIVIVKFILA